MVALRVGKKWIFDFFFSPKRFIEFNSESFLELVNLD